MTIWKRLLWPLLWAAATLCVAKDCSNHIVGVEGEDIVLSPSVAGDGNLTRTHWKKGEKIVASSWVSFSPGTENQRLSLDSSSGKLILKNLSKEDTGYYTAEVFIDEKIKEMCFDLKILDCSNHIVGVEGEDIVLSPSVAGNGNLTRTHWKKGEKIVASSWVSFSPGTENQRLSLDSSSGKLILKNLSKEDTGYYTAEVFIDEKIKEMCFDLKILVWPDINCTINNGTIQLSCTSPSQDLPLTYSWENIRNEEIIFENGSVVLLQRNPSHFQKITCYVIASGSNASTSINLSDCIPVEEPDHQSRSRMHLIAIPIILVILLIPVLFFCIKKYLKKRKERSIPNESESGAKNARGNCKEESSELPEEERKALQFELKSVGGKEKSEETSMLES